MRFWKGLLVEVLIPIVIVLALGGLRNIVKPTTVALNLPQRPTQQGSLFHSQYTYNLPQCSAENLVFRCVDPDNRSGASGKCEYYISSTREAVNKCQEKKIAIYPPDDAAEDVKATAQRMVKWGNSHYGKNVSWSYNPAAPTSTTPETIGLDFNSFVYFDSQRALDAYILDPSYPFNNDATHPLIGSAILLKAGYPSWSYVVRQNVTFIGYGGNPTYWTPDDTDH